MEQLRSAYLATRIITYFYSRPGSSITLTIMNYRKTLYSQLKSFLKVFSKKNPFPNLR